MHSIQCRDTYVCPSKIVCVGRNYAAHAKELGNEVPEEPVIFIKPNSTISDTLLPGRDEVLHYEAELCFLVENNRLSALGVGLDLTKRETQKKLKNKGLPWERAKAFDGAAVFSKFIDVDRCSTMDNLGIRLFINGTIRQSGRVSQMIFNPQKLLQSIQAFISFEDGDILMTGTPEGVGELVPGSVFLAEVLDSEEVILTCQWITEGPRDT